MVDSIGEVLANPQAASRALGIVGILAGLGETDVRDLSAKKVPVWAVVAGSAAIGLALGIWTIKILPAEWIGKLRGE